MSVTLAVDAMGGDHGLVVTIPASTGLLAELPDLKIRLVGNADLINQALVLVSSEIDLPLWARPIFFLCSSVRGLPLR